MTNIGIYPKHFDFEINTQALQESPETEVFFLDNDMDTFPEIDILLIQGLLGDFPTTILEQYADTTTIVWQSGIWHRHFGKHILIWINIADIFMGYDPHIEHIAQLKGKKIWKFPPLFRRDIIDSFNEGRAENDITTANIWHSSKLGYFPIRAHELKRRCVIFYDHLWEEEEILDFELKGVEFRKLLSHEDYLEFLRNQCSFVCQMTEMVAWGQCIRDAVCVGVPSIANTFYQRVFYPGLYCDSIEHTQKMLSADYLDYKDDVEQAQDTLKYLNSEQAKNDFIIYLLSETNDGLPRWPLR